ncbi:MAG TPA: glycine cleavage system protein GcvH [Jatrophihabitans sp.]|jgi:glycine cleavage system H protein|uniref:glycine cleavage system protein GcvH n=1 Tax=Jatrophihabitans sp. TaxID=1932789 RepID=UPI002E002752|nr:glycine cleavage system protein GcvH [Jatrophihabitans sp.]
MSDVPDDLKYTAEHEWVRETAGSKTARVGVTDYAQEALGDVVYVSLPEVGATIEKGAAIGEIESTKSVSDIYAPVSGTVSARNDALDDQPELINSDPYGEGWIFEIDIADDGGSDGLLDAAAYGTLAG